jgi:hypothetical protein
MDLSTETRKASQKNTRAANILARWIAAVRDAMTELLSPYRPERHYMRGGRTGGAS